MSHELKLMHLAASPKAGGAETFFVRLLTELSQRAKTVPVVRRKSWLEQRLTSGAMAPHTLPFRQMLDFETRPGLKQLIEHVQPHVVTAWMSRAAAAIPRDLA